MLPPRHRTELRGTVARADERPPTRIPLPVRLSEVGACALVFASAFEPNLSMRFGPFVALAILILCNVARERIGKTEFALAAFLLWALASQVWTTQPGAFDLEMLSALSCAAIFIGLRRALSAGASIVRMALAYAAGCCVGLFRTSSSFATPEAIRDFSGRVSQAGDLNVNYVAYASVTCILILTLLLREQSADRRRAVTGFAGRAAIAIVIAVLAAATFATQTRGAQVALVLLGAWMLLTLVARPLKLTIGVVVAVALAICAGITDLLLGALDYGSRSIGGLSGRLDLWATAREVWQDQPIIGSGFGAVRAATPSGLPAHNMILEVGATLGLVGVALFLTFIVFAITDRTKPLPSVYRRTRLGALVVALSPIALSGTWEFSTAAWVALAMLSHPSSVHRNA